MKKLYNTALFFIFLLFSVSVIFAQESEREKGIEFYNKGEYQKAVETLQKAVEADEEDKNAWLYLGMSHARLKKQSLAEKALNKADKISAKNKESVEAQAQVKITSKPRPSYTDSARMTQTQGIVKIAIEFGADGKIKAIVPFINLPEGLTQMSVAAAKQIKFEPATKDGKPYSTIGVLTYSFKIY